VTDLDRLKAAAFEEGDHPPDTEAAPVPRMLVDVKADPSPLALMAEAIAKGHSPADLHALLDFAERVKKDMAAERFAAALAKFQAECPQILKEREVRRKSEGGQQGGVMYRFASYDDIKKKVSPLQRECGIVTTFTAPKIENGTLMGTIRVRVGAHCEETSLPIQIPKGINTNSAQDMIAATTYLRRILFCMALDIQVTDDLDDDGASLGDFVTEAEEKELKDGIEKCKQAGKPVNLPLFLEWLEAPSLDKVLRRKLDMALKELDRKLKEKK
jgi:hypothetical protein